MSGAVVRERPGPGAPRPYEFPTFERQRLSNGLGLIVLDLPGRPLVSASLIARHGAADEPAPEAGVSVLMARALSEGTEHYDAVALVEAAERLGASLHAQSGWDATTAGVDVTASRLSPALELLAEMVRRPVFPEREVTRLREERLNDILQARADPRRRSDIAFAQSIYVSDSPYHRPSAGTHETVTGLDPDELRSIHTAAFEPADMTLVVGGELGGRDVRAIAEEHFGGWGRNGAAAGASGSGGATPAVEVPAGSAVRERFVRVIHRPGSVQTEVRIGHPGLPRRTPDFHAISVMSAILGGLFNSRLNMNLREEKGYTYGAWAGFDLRRGAGPFLARAAVNTEVTVPAIRETLDELERMRTSDVTADELRTARDFLVGVFPLRFETAGSIVGALSGLVVHDLPDDELARYRPAIEAVTGTDVRRVAEATIDLERAAIVLVGDVDAFGADLEAAALGPIVIEHDDQGVPGSRPPSA
jgi:zinc protease